MESNKHTIVKKYLNEHSLVESNVVPSIISLKAGCRKLWTRFLKQ